MGFPDKKTLGRIRKKLENVEGTKLISKNATALEKLRWSICQEFVRYLNDNSLKNYEMAEELGIDAGDMSKILNHRIEKFSTDKLLELLQLIKPCYQVELKTSVAS